MARVEGIAPDSAGDWAWIVGLLCTGLMFSLGKGLADWLPQAWQDWEAKQAASHAAQETTRLHQRAAKMSDPPPTTEADLRAAGLIDWDDTKEQGGTGNA